MTPISYKLPLPAASSLALKVPFHRGKYVDGSHKSNTVGHPAKEDCAPAFLHRDARACQRDRSFRSERLEASHFASGQGCQSADTRGGTCCSAERAGYCATAISQQRCSRRIASLRAAHRQEVGDG